MYYHDQSLIVGGWGKWGWQLDSREPQSGLVFQYFNFFQANCCIMVVVYISGERFDFICFQSFGYHYECEFSKSFRRRTRVAWKELRGNVYFSLHCVTRVILDECSSHWLIIDEYSGGCVMVVLSTFIHEVQVRVPTLPHCCPPIWSHLLTANRLVWYASKLE